MTDSSSGLILPIRLTAPWPPIALRHSTPSRITRSAAILTLVALVFGLPNFLVICAPRVGTPHIELTCSAGCHHAHAGREVSQKVSPKVADRGDADDGVTPRLSDDSGGCVHWALGVELGRSPTKPVAVPDSQLLCRVTIGTTEAETKTAQRRSWQYATGPPRPGRTIRLLRTTVLQE